MKLNELLNFRASNKYILTEDYVSDKSFNLYYSNSDLKKGNIILPMGLVFTIVSIRLNNASQTMICKIIKSKKIVEAIYKPNNIDPKFYTAFRWDDKIYEDGYVKFVLRDNNLFNFLNTVKTEQFTSEYKKITDEISEQ